MMYSEILNDTGITIRQIQMCIAVYRLGSLAEAAKALGVSPSAISMGIRDAESSLQSELFHRGNKSMKQSEAGRVLFPRMEELLRQVGEFRNVFDSVDENARGHIIIGASSTVGCYVLPDLIATFQEKYPLLDIDLMVGNTAEMLEKLVNFTVDIAFVEGPSFRNDCELDRLWEDEMVVFAKSGSEFSKKSRVSWSHLSSARWLLREDGSGTHSILAAHFSKYGFHPKRAIHVGNTESVIRCVEKGLGIACLSRKAIQRSLQLDLIEVIPVPVIKRHFFHATLPGRYLGKTSQLFLEEARLFKL